MRKRGKSDKYLANLEFRVTRLINDCDWKAARMVTADSFQAWRRRVAMAPKTANDYLEAVSCFFNWLIKHERVGSNPLKSVEKVIARQGEVRERRAFSQDEVKQLLAAAGDRSPVYLMAVHTGLRRSELEALQWGDVALEASMPFLKVRASTTKNGKPATMRLHGDLVRMLAEIKPADVEPCTPVFGRVPRIERFKRDLKTAGILFQDSQGRCADFHSLRKTFGTNLANGGVASRVAMTLMRHSDRRLTDKIYTDESLLATATAIDALPSFTEPPSQGASQIASQILGAEGHGTSSAVTAGSGAKVVQTTANIGESHPVTQTGTESHLRESRGSGGARTRNLCRDRAAL